MNRRDCRELIAACRAKGLGTGRLDGNRSRAEHDPDEAVEDEILPADPALRMGRYLRQGGEAVYEYPNPSSDGVTHLLAVMRAASRGASDPNAFDGAKVHG